MTEEKYPEGAESYDRIISQSKIFNIGDKPFLDIIIDCVNDISTDLPVTILEPGCGTGIITKRIAKIKNVKIIAVDPDVNYFKAAKIKLSKYNYVELLQESALTLKIKPVNLIVMRYVYHHIHDKEKRKFIQNMYDNLKTKGTIIILDEFIPSYSNEEEWKQSLINYHDKRSEIALKMDDKVTADCEQESKEIALKREEEEFKVHLGILEEDLKTAGFVNIDIKLVEHSELQDSTPLGMYIITATKK